MSVNLQDSGQVRYEADLPTFEEMDVGVKYPTSDTADGAGDGEVTWIEFKRAMTAQPPEGPGLSDEVVSQLFDNIDTDGDREISETEYATVDISSLIDKSKQEVAFEDERKRAEDEKRKAEEEEAPNTAFDFDTLDRGGIPGETSRFEDGRIDTRFLMLQLQRPDYLGLSKDDAKKVVAELNTNGGLTLDASEYSPAKLQAVLVHLRIEGDVSDYSTGMEDVTMEDVQRRM